MQDIRFDHFFHSFIYSAQIDLPTDAILKSCLDIQEKDPLGLTKSNAGWHSKMQFLNDDTDTSILNVLAKQTLDLANSVSVNENLNLNFTKLSYWININQENQYNVVHSHPKADILAVYYAKVETESGALVLLRNDGSAHSDLYSRSKKQSRFDLTPIPGRVYIFPSHLLHYVENNKSSDIRVSVAYNIKTV